MNAPYALVLLYHGPGARDGVAVEGVTLGYRKEALEAEGREYACDERGGPYSYLSYRIVRAALDPTITNVAQGIEVPGTDSDFVDALKGENNG